LTAINQYFLHAELCSHWGYGKLAKVVKKQSIDEMKHAHSLIERILHLDGLPNVQRMGKVRVGETVGEQFMLDFALEQEAVVRLNAGIATCIAAGDHGSRVLLESILTSEESHIDWLDAQQKALSHVGEQAYLAQMVSID
jgi:bacterioferritin